MPRGLPDRDPMYHIEGLSRSVKAKVTTLGEAAADYAFRGAAHPDDYEAIEDYAQVARYNLERNIKTLLDRKDRRIRQLEKELEKKGAGEVTLGLTRDEAELIFRIFGQHIVGTMRTNGIYEAIKEALGAKDVDCKPLPLSRTSTRGVDRLTFPYPYPEEEKKHG